MTLAFDGLTGDHLVLQRRQPLAIHGRANPGATVEVSIAGHRAQAPAGADGRWCAHLPALEAGGPHRLEASSAGGRIIADDVLIGEVWLAAGQSNMDWRLGDTRDGAAALAAADGQPGIRAAVMPREWTPGEDRDIAVPWQVGARATAAACSAVAWHTAAHLHRALGVPVGIIDAARGGSRIHSWLPRADLARDPLWGPLLERHLAELPRHAELLAAHRRAAAAWQPPADPGLAAHAATWADPALDDRAWAPMRLPCWWQYGGHERPGVLWFRRTVELDAAAAADPAAVLHLGMIDKAERTWVNGVEVGATGFDNPDCWRTLRSYRIPTGVLRAGANTIAVRACSNVFQGGFTGPAAAMRLAGAGWSRPLAGPWRWRVEHDFGTVAPPRPPWGPGSSDGPAILWESLVAPARRHALAGFLWYQGESDEDAPEDHRRLLTALVRAWRREWGGTLPFLSVQLPGIGSDLSSGTRWAALRAAQTACLDEPATALVPTIDIGDANDLHPHNKAEVGRRLALAALAVAYGDRRPGLLAPRIARITAEGGRLRLAVADAGDGLRLGQGGLRGFELAGGDGVFHPAEALVDGACLVVWSAAVPAPRQVRYAWADMPVADVASVAGLPLMPCSARAADG